MVKKVGAYFIRALVFGGPFDLDVTTDPLPRGTNVLATCSLSKIDSSGNAQRVKVARASIKARSVYNERGEGPLELLRDPVNTLFIENCGRIRFTLLVGQVQGPADVFVDATALFTIYEF